VSIEDEIVAWSSMRPAWQRVVLRRIAQGEEFSADDVSSLVDRMVDQGSSQSEPFDVTDFPARADTDSCVRILEIRRVSHVNALVQDEPLAFADSGLTVVYGDNGSGKSGFARLIKQIVRAKHSESILTDIFRDRGTGRGSAEMVIQVADQRVECQWPTAIPPQVARIAFFDAACGDLYLTSESDVMYRPSSLFVMDGLIRVCDAARAELDRRISANSASAVELPRLPQGTEAEKLISSLSAQTTEAQIGEACAVPLDVDEQIEELAKEEARLRATDPSSEKKRLLSVAAKLSKLSTHLDACRTQLGGGAIARVQRMLDELAHKKQASAIASVRSFQGEPLAGVGAPAWRELWEAARRFAVHSRPEEAFPPTGPGARCPLCQQELGSEASQRLRRFEDFVEDSTQQELLAAREAVGRTRNDLEGFAVLSAAIQTALEGLMDTHEAVARPYRAVFERYEQRRISLLEVLAGERWEGLELPTPDTVLPDAADLGEGVRSMGEAIGDSTFAEALRKTIGERRELEARRSLAAVRATALGELERLRSRASLERAKESTNTQGISRKAADMTREHVTALMRDRFTRESDRLRLERVTLEDIGGRKGTLQHRPTFVGAIQQVPMEKVLSEGEQTALGLAGFFTEVHFEQSKSAIVLDDPVSSLDHVRRGYVAGRLVEIAKERQVVVFTHDIAFVADLRGAAEGQGVPVCERSVERRPSGQPGACLGTFPWKAKDVGERLQELESDLAAIRRDIAELDGQRYEERTASWAGRLSETWERLVHEVVGHVVDRGTQEVRPRMFRILARISADDDRIYQAGYAKCSRWTRRHDKSVEVNYVAPTPDEMAEALREAREFYKRIRSYRQ
jgi:energy-coupling factor transporter ATP-binding protein EcfA2